MNAEIGVITNPNSRKNRGRSNRIAELSRIVDTRGLVPPLGEVERVPKDER